MCEQRGGETGERTALSAGRRGAFWAACGAFLVAAPSHTDQNTMLLARSLASRFCRRCLQLRSWPCAQRVGCLTSIRRPAHTRPRAERERRRAEAVNEVDPVIPLVAFHVPRPHLRPLAAFYVGDFEGVCRGVHVEEGGEVGGEAVEIGGVGRSLGHCGRGAGGHRGGFVVKEHLREGEKDGERGVSMARTRLNKGMLARVNEGGGLAVNRRQIILGAIALFVCTPCSRRLRAARSCSRRLQAMHGLSCLVRGATLGLAHGSRNGRLWRLVTPFVLLQSLQQRNRGYSLIVRALHPCSVHRVATLTLRLTLALTRTPALTRSCAFWQFSW